MVVVITGLIASVAPALLIQVNRFFMLARVRANLQSEARAVMYIMTRELRQAQSTSIVIDQAANQPYYSRITFTKKQGTTMTFYQSGSSLIRKVGTNTVTLTKSLSYWPSPSPAPTTWDSSPSR